MSVSMTQGYTDELTQRNLRLSLVRIVGAISHSLSQGRARRHGQGRYQDECGC